MTTVKFEVKRTAATYSVFVVPLETKHPILLEFNDDNVATRDLPSGNYMLSWVFAGDKDSTFQMTVTGCVPSPLKYPPTPDKASDKITDGLYWGHNVAAMKVG